MFMRCLLVFVFSCSLALVPGSCFGQELSAALAARVMPDASKDSQTVQQLIRMNEEMVGAQIRGDVAAIEKFLTDDYTKMHSHGGVQTRAVFLKDNYPGRYSAIDLSDVTGRVYGGTTAILLGHTRTKTAGNETRTSFMDVWVQQNGKWKVAAWATTEISSANSGVGK